MLGRVSHAALPEVVPWSRDRGREIYLINLT